jgi:sugar/nucleoside kinase (ribokinase family)
VTGVIVVGDIMTDVVAVHGGQLAVGSDTPARIRVGGGGSGANTAAWLAFAGAPVTLVGAVGADPAGEARVRELASAGVACAVPVKEAATGAVVVLSGGAERTMLADRGANLLLTPADVDAGAALAPAARHLHLSGYALLDGASREAGRYALAAAAARGLTTSVDAASAAPLRGLPFLAWVRGVDLLLANADEAATLVGPGAPDVLARRLASGVAHAVVKCGPDGAVWASAHGPVVAVPAEPAEVVDPTGAGDAFAAGLLAAWLAGAEPGEALRAGARLGARAVSAGGGRPDPAGG